MAIYTVYTMPMDLHKTPVHGVLLNRDKGSSLRSYEPKYKYHLSLTGVLYDGGVGGPPQILRVLRYLTRFLRVLSTYA